MAVYVDRSEPDAEIIHIVSARKTDMSEVHTKTSSVRRLKISDETRKAYADRDKSLDNLDPDAPVMPPEFWDGATNREILPAREDPDFVPNRQRSP